MRARVPPVPAAAGARVLAGLFLVGLSPTPRFACGPFATACLGQRVSPPLFASMEIIGKASTLTRLRALRATL